ncbi:Cysteine synthase [Geobacillus proteiniphilus]|uniref:Cysteine synthase n=1 Tax=Geobacillus proteiniphilus TaxID=860353 RepID=A0A1Q5SWI7_9BACL|nr:Cysteine synthase [Geobacillus proteiniphilus]
MPKKPPRFPSFIFYYKGEYRTRTGEKSQSVRPNERPFAKNDRKTPGAAGGTDCLNEKRKIIYNE